MKIRSVLLGSVAIAGLTTAGYAADLGVVTSLDVCDALGVSGLTISSDTDCLQISGEVKFEYDWGDFDVSFPLTTGDLFDRTATADVKTVMSADGTPDSALDIDVWLKFVASASTDFGPAKAVLKLVQNNMSVTNWAPVIKEAYVSVGDTTMISMGFQPSLFKTDSDIPLNYLKLFNSDDVNEGVGFDDSTTVTTGGGSIQIVSNLGNGLSIGGSIENLGTYTDNGYVTYVGTLSYAGDGLSGHVSAAYDSYTSNWQLHAGFTGTWDTFKVVGAIATNSSGWWNVLGSASATFDMFTLAGSVEATSASEWGAGASLTAEVTDGVKLNLGGRYWASQASTIAQVEAGVSAAVTETITLSGSIGYYMGDVASDFYGIAGVAWNPGGGATFSATAEAHQTGGYKIVVKGDKKF